MKENAANRDIVIFIGAGFSHGAHLPLMSEFGHKAKKDRDGLTEHASAPMSSRRFRYAAPMLLDAARTFERFQKFLMGTVTLMNSDVNDLETVFCIAEALSESDQRTINIDGQPYSLDQVISDIQMWLWKVYQQLPILNSSKHEDSKQYALFFELLKENNIVQRTTVLSTNYDLVYEYFSWKHGLPCAYPISWDKQFVAGHGSEPYIYQGDSRHEKTILCKLHGSVNYFENHNVNDEKLYVACDLGNEIPIGNSGVWRGKPALFAVDAIWNIRKKYGNGFTPAIIPPSYAKLGRRPWLRAIWNAALEALKNAKAIIFIGYSFPYSDGFMRALLHGAMSQRMRNLPLEVYVVDKSDKTLCRYEELFGPTLKGLREPQTFDQAINGELRQIMEKS